MLFQKRFWMGIADGEITMTFRRWKRPRVVAGNVYRTPGGRIRVDAIDEVDPAGVTDGEAVASGHPSAEALRADLRGEEGDPLFRISFHVLDEPDPREVLANDAEIDAADVAEIDRRLERLDRASPRGPWTMAVLHMIEERPHIRAPDLAADLGREVQAFKRDVRKLKNLGLTLSFRPGYRLSPRGEAYLDRTERA